MGTGVDYVEATSADTVSRDWLLRPGAPSLIDAASVYLNVGMRVTCELTNMCALLLFTPDTRVAWKRQTSQ